MRRDRRRKALWIILLSVLLWTGGGVLCSREIYAAETGADAAEVNTSQGEGGDEGTYKRRIINIGIVLSGFAFMGILSWIAFKTDEENTKKLEQGFAEFDRIIEKYEQVRKGRSFDDMRLKYSSIKEGIRNHWGTIQAGEPLSEEAQEVLGLRKYLDRAFWEDEFSVMDEAKKKIDDHYSERPGRKMQKYREYRNELASTKGKTKKEKIQEIEEYCHLAKEIVEDICDYEAKVNRYIRHDCSVIDAEETGAIASAILNLDIRYDIQIREITGQGKRRGKMSCHGADGKYRKGIFCLDDITVLGSGKLGEVIGSTGIYACGYDSEAYAEWILGKRLWIYACEIGCGAEKEGIELRSIREFSCVPLGEEAEAKPEKSALLCPGKEYRLTCRTDKQEASMIVKISE